MSAVGMDKRGLLLPVAPTLSRSAFDVVDRVSSDSNEPTDPLKAGDPKKSRGMTTSKYRGLTKHEAVHMWQWKMHGYNKC